MMPFLVYCAERMRCKVPPEPPEVPSDITARRRCKEADVTTSPSALLSYANAHTPAADRVAVGGAQ